MNFSMPENSTISSNRRRISPRLMPRMAPLRKMFSRPLSSGWKPVPTPSRPCSDQVRKAALDAAEGSDADPQEGRRDREAEREARQIDWAFAAHDAPAEAVDDADHGIEVVQQTPLLGHDRALKADRRDI